MPISGTDLKVERVRANVTIIALAAQMGLSRQTLWGIERAGMVDADRVQQYRAALKTLRDGTGESGEEPAA